MVVSGCWETHDGHPFWVWTYKSGWKNYNDAVKVVIESTVVKGCNLDFAISLAKSKVETIYRSLDLPDPNLVDIHGELFEWYRDHGHVLQLQCSYFVPPIISKLEQG